MDKNFAGTGTLGLWAVTEKAAGVCAELDELSYEVPLTAAYYKKIIGRPDYAVLVGGELGVLGTHYKTIQARAFCVVRQTAPSQLTICRLGVKPEFRRSGEARNIINRLDRDQLIVVLRETNKVGIKCAKTLGFLATKVLKLQFGNCDGIQFTRKPSPNTREDNPSQPFRD